VPPCWQSSRVLDGFEGEVTAGVETPGEAIALEEFRERVQRQWRRALMDALSEPARDELDRDEPDGATPLGQLAARAVARVWPEVEELVRPIFETSAVLALDRQAPSRPTAVPPAVPAIPPAAWLSAEDVAPVLHMTAHTLRGPARKGESPVVVRRIGGRWCFSRADLDRLVAATT
jgi:hypothetical protein